MTITVTCGDCREVVKTLPAGSVDSIVTDPPYGYGMNKDWDNGIAFDPDTWRAISEPLRQGGFLLAFGGTKTYHRMVCAIEDAGFIIQDCLMWIYGTGFPKSKSHLKPAYEPIVLAYKPGGKQRMQIDECSIGSIKRAPSSPRGPSDGVYGRFDAQSGNERGFDTGIGRWPANICHDDSDEVISVFSEGNIRFKNIVRGPHSRARFFYSAKAGELDRWGTKHPTVKPVSLMQWLVRLVTSPNGLVLDPFAGSGSTGLAAMWSGRSCILIEREVENVEDINARLIHGRKLLWRMKPPFDIEE